MRIVFMGTPDFAVPSLEKLIEKYEVVGVFTQPDRPKGRGQKLQISPVKEVALKHNIPVFQPVKLKNNLDAIETLRTLAPDLIIVIAFGQILPKEILDIPPRGCINVHASILPQLRGAAPINWSIINGLKKTGVTTMMMDVGLDTGDMLVKKEVEILSDDTAGELHDRLMAVGGEILIKTLDLIEKGELNREKQDDSKSSYAPMMSKELGHIDWSKTAEEVHNLARGVTPWPGAYCYYKGSIIKIWKTKIISDSKEAAASGEVTKVSKSGIEVACGKGSILILELQEVGGKRLSVSNYLNGHEILEGEILE
jgi:methionyl-tRNA formyltransferase